MFYIVRTVHKFDFRPVIRQTLRHNIEETHVFDKICFSPPDRHLEC